MNIDIFHRRHDQYRANSAVWERSRDAYGGGRAYLDRALIRHVSEIDLEFAERRRRAYYFNYPRGIAQRITQYALASDPARNGGDPELIEDWSLRGLRTSEVMRQASTMLNVYGRAWLHVTAPAFSGEADCERARRERLRPYCVALSPLAVPDWAYAADGRLAWVITEERHTDDLDPMRERRSVIRRRLWTRTEWRLFERDGGLVASGVNPAGQVPFVAITEPDGFGIEANHWFEDVVRISDAILNNESEAQMNIVKQMFGMLVISDSFARGAQKAQSPGDGAQSFSQLVARTAAIWETPEEKGLSRYISPSGVETAAIRATNAELKRELYDVVGLAVQSRSGEAQTAESKAWDFRNVSRFLAGRADILEQAETEAWKLMAAWDPSIRVPEVTYNREFAVRDLQSSIAALVQLSTLPGGVEFRREILRAGLELLDEIKSVGTHAKAAIQAEIEEQTEKGTEPS